MAVTSIYFDEKKMAVKMEEIDCTMLVRYVGKTFLNNKLVNGSVYEGDTVFTYANGIPKYRIKNNDITIAANYFTKI